MMDLIRRMLEPIARRVQLMIGRAIITTVTDSTGIQGVQISCYADEVRDGVQRLQQYGFTSNPKPGAQGIALFFNGNREDGVIIATEDKRYRVKNLESGEVAIYTDEGDEIRFKRGNEILIKSSTRVVIECDDIKLGANTNLKTLIDSRIISYYNEHTHTAPGGITGVPAVLLNEVMVATENVSAI